MRKERIMLVVKVYLCAKGDEREERLLGNVRIANVGKVEGTEDTSRYVACFGTVDAVEGLPALYVEHVARKGFWRLISDVLVGALVKREEGMLGRKGG